MLPFWGTQDDASKYSVRLCVLGAQCVQFQLSVAHLHPPQYLGFRVGPALALSIQTSRVVSWAASRRTST